MNGCQVEIALADGEDLHSRPKIFAGIDSLTFFGLLVLSKNDGWAASDITPKEHTHNLQEHIPVELFRRGCAASSIAS